MKVVKGIAYQHHHRQQASPPRSRHGARCCAQKAAARICARFGKVHIVHARDSQGIPLRHHCSRRERLCCRCQLVKAVHARHCRRAPATTSASHDPRLHRRRSAADPHCRPRRHPPGGGTHRGGTRVGGAVSTRRAGPSVPGGTDRPGSRRARSRRRVRRPGRARTRRVAAARPSPPCAPPQRVQLLGRLTPGLGEVGGDEVSIRYSPDERTINRIRNLAESGGDEENK